MNVFWILSQFKKNYNHEEVNCNGEGLTFTLQVIKI